MSSPPLSPAIEEAARMIRHRYNALIQVRNYMMTIKDRARYFTREERYTFGADGHVECYLSTEFTPRMERCYQIAVDCLAEVNGELAELESALKRLKGDDNAKRDRSRID